MKKTDKKANKLGMTGGGQSVNTVLSWNLL